MRFKFGVAARKFAQPTVGAALIIVGCIGFAVGNVKMPSWPDLPAALQINLPQPGAATPDGQALGSKAPKSSNTILPSNTLGSNIWQFEVGAGGWGNNEVQYYTNRPQNAHIETNKLTITALRENYSGSQYTSARLNTRGSFEVKYGHLVLHDVTLPKGAGTWPAIWLWPSGKKYSQSQMKGSGDPGLINGEIDILEYVGAAPGEMNASAHAYANYPGRGERSGQVIVDPLKPHDISFDWTTESLSFGVDGKTYFTVKNPHTGPSAWPYDQPYFLVVNMAMGGDWGGMAKTDYPPLGIDNKYTSWQFSVGSITYTPL